MAEFNSNLTGTAKPSSLEKAKSTISSSDIEASIRRQYARLNFVLYLEMGEEKLQQENHEKRLQNLRKELVDLKNSEWQYDPIEKYIGQS